MPSAPLQDDFPISPTQRMRTALLVLLIAVVPVVVLLLLANVLLHKVTGTPEVQAFTVSFLSIIFEAAPFILLGTILSGLIEVFIPSQTLLRFVPRSRFGQLAAGAAAGFFVPVCECGIVVILRRLLKKGMPLPMGLAYMLIAPIVNPVVIISTFAAYRAKPEWLLMPVARTVLGIAVGMTVAALVGRTKFLSQLKVEVPAGHDHPAPSVAGSVPAPAAVDRRSLWRKLSAACDHSLSEFLDVAVFLVAGAAVAAFVQTAITRSLLAGVGHSPVLAVPSMMGLAVLLNICSEADAFVAVSFSAAFSFASQLAFLVLGPMLDCKLMIMYTMAFRRRMILALIVAITLTILVVMQLVALADFFWWGGKL